MTLDSITLWTEKHERTTAVWQKWRFSAPQIPIAIGMVNQTLVLRINPDSYRDGKNRQLLVAADRQTV